jgi:hypothetical protein
MKLSVDLVHGLRVSLEAEGSRVRQADPDPAIGFVGTVDSLDRFGH